MKTEDLRRMIEDVCQAMLGLDLSETDELPTFEPSVVASVSIIGEHNATLEVAACQNAAISLAATMFATEPSQITKEEVLDAVSEVANMIGGNIKGLIGGDNSLSLPCVGKATTKTADGDSSIAFGLTDGWLQVFFRQNNPSDTTAISC